MRIIQRLEQVMYVLEIAVDDVEMVDILSAKKECEADVPVGLSPGSKDNHVVHVMPFLKQHSTCERSTESCYFRRVKESARLPRIIEEGEAPMLRGS